MREKQTFSLFIRFYHNEFKEEYCVSLFSYCITFVTWNQSSIHAGDCMDDMSHFDNQHKNENNQHMSDPIV